MALGASHEHAHTNADLDELRLLTEADNLVASMGAFGRVPETVLRDERINLETAVYEMAIPAGVASSIHPVEYLETAAGKREARMFMWMGKNLVQAAMGGRQFHRTAAARERVEVEIDEADFTQERLRPGIAQAFLSPRMSPSDAPEHVAKAEHLHDDDSIRVSRAVTNARGEVVGRRLESLLVRDVPLEAWVAMLKDPNNIFGRAFELESEQSALSVMKLFRHMELPEELLPEGPITLVAEVQKYIKDNDAYDSVGRQLDGFRSGQAEYKQQAELAAEEWLKFELELARSLRTGRATNTIKGFIARLQHNWNDEMLRTIESHSLGDFEFIMTRRLAATLERAQRNIVRGKAALATGNESVMSQVGYAVGQRLGDNIRSLQIMRANNLIGADEYMYRQAEIDQTIAGHNIQGGGGCAGEVSAGFREFAENDPAGDGSGQTEQSSDWERGNRKWKLGSCQVKSCPSPKPTEVGPCSVCKRCQAVFDSGGDPTKQSFIEAFTKVEKPLEFSIGRQETDDTELARQVDEVFEDTRAAAITAEDPGKKIQHVAQVAMAA